MQVRHILFDLDGTLAPIDMETFLPKYMKAITIRFGHRLPIEEFPRKLLESTMVMVNNLDPNRTNEEVFWEDFSRKLGTPRQTLEPVFQEFYASEYRELKNGLLPSALAGEVIAEAIDLGFKVTVATNPIFPLRAARERLAWIGCERFPFQLITSMEKMHFCKPHLEYYREILSILGARPEECLMIGNDMEEDMVASLLGIRTCLVTDRMIQRGKPRAEPDYRCTLGGVREVIRRLK
jgi:FMN phosphatase YigB (HAD superfamily)